VDEVARLLADPVARAGMAKRAFPFGNGRAAPRIAEIIEDWMKRRTASRRLAGSW
jgi:UDP-N-acetylglucosamine 2-epimerase (non-hydrolysing)